MARRRRASAAEDLMDLVAMLPWWVGVALALVGYLVLHRMALQPLVAVATPGQGNSMVLQGVWKGLATAGQYIVPLICLGGAGMSAWRRHERKKLVVDVAQSKASDALDGMSWQSFEKLVGEGFRLQGYDVVETGGGGADGGIDLVLTKRATNSGEKFLVQCKQWRALKVGVDVVRELYGVMAARGATGGFVVTSGRFTEAAVAFASGRNVTLIDGPQLHGLIAQAQASRFPSMALQRREAEPVMAKPSAGAQPSMEPSCPTCSKPMVRRTAKRGASAGNEFWGCTAYPSCRGTRPVA